MLILSRRVGEKVVIDGEIIITVLEAGRGGQVRLGIDAPRRHRVLRYELHEEITAENRGATVRPEAVPDLGGILGNLPRAQDSQA
ncbi:MAG: carbon storage regulator [Planctomycetota bacterium]